MSIKSRNVLNDGLIFNIDGANIRSAGQVLHAFTGSGTFTPSANMEVEFLIVAGGGSGGNDNAGGGGAGGLIHGKRYVTSGTAYTITVGAGGAAQANGEYVGNSGSNSTAMGFQAVGGGGGAGGTGVNPYAGLAGGSGGGGPGEGTQTLVGAGVVGQGNSGGRGGGASDFNGGGGGGAGTAGFPSGPGTNTGGNGGEGKYLGNRFGTTYGESGWFAGGGAGAISNGPESAPPDDYCNGGIGGGGDSSKPTMYSGSPGSTNTGGGGGGSAYNGSAYTTSGAGGSGIVLITYPGLTSKATGGTITNVRGSNVVTDTINGHNGGKNNGVAWTTAGGGAFDFDGTNDYIQFNHNNDFNAPYFTIDTWIKLDSNTTPTQLVAKRTDAQNGTYWLYYNGSGTLMFDHYRSGVQNRLNTSWSPSTGTWYHVCASLSPTAKIVCVNGAQLNSQSLTNHATDQNTANLRVGMDSIGSNTYPMNGQVASVRIYNYGMTLAEMQQNYYATRSRFGY